MKPRKFYTAYLDTNESITFYSSKGFDTKEEAQKDSEEKSIKYRTEVFVLQILSSTTSVATATIKEF